MAGDVTMDVIQPAVSKWQRERGLDHKGQAGTLASAARLQCPARIVQSNQLYLTTDQGIAGRPKLKIRQKKIPDEASLARAPQRSRQTAKRGPWWPIEGLR